MPSKKKKGSKKKVKKEEKAQQETWAAINKVEKVLKSMTWPDHAYIQGALPAARRALPLPPLSPRVAPPRR